LGEKVGAGVRRCGKRKEEEGGTKWTFHGKVGVH